MNDEVNQKKNIEQEAVRLLSYREYTVKQLQEKLLLKNFEKNEIDHVLDDLVKRNLLSNERFAEQYISYRMKKGFGPVRIRKEMQEKGISEELIERSFEESEVDWKEIMVTHLKKKFGETPVLNYSDRAKRARFLEYRGFVSAEIRQCLFNDG